MIRHSAIPALGTSFGRKFSSVLGDRRGAVAIVMAITLPVVIGAAGLGVEAGKWYMLKRQAQTAADSGAFAGALELAAGTNNRADPAARQEAARNGSPEGGDVTVTVNIPPTSGSHVGNAKAVEVIVTRSEPLLLAKLFLSTPTPIVARAVGLVTVTGNACILATNSSAAKALWITGNTNLTLDNCSLASDSSSSDSIVFQGSSGTVVPSVWSAGGISSNGGATFPDSLHTYAWTVQDP
jgi:Flp pilus assembly protein TadG